MSLGSVGPGPRPPRDPFPGARAPPAWVVGCARPLLGEAGIGAVLNPRTRDLRALLGCVYLRPVHSPLSPDSRLTPVLR